MENYPSDKDVTLQGVRFMINYRISTAIVLAAMFALAVPAMAQPHRLSNQGNHGNHHNHSGYSPGYHIDHHNHAIRDSHGHVIGNYHHDVIHQNSTYIVPHTGHAHHGTYYQRDNGYYYYPQTANLGNAQLQSQPVQVKFGSFSHVDDLAFRLEKLSNEFCLDLHYNYSHSPGFTETYSEAYQILEVAKYIHAAEHHNDRKAIAERLGGLDQLFHHVQDDVRGWHRHHHKQIGQLGIQSKMDLMESTLHHLMNDVGVAETIIDEHGEEQAPPPAGGNGIAPPPAAGGGISPSVLPPAGGGGPSPFSPPPSNPNPIR